jgi:hypothetical protein
MFAPKPEAMERPAASSDPELIFNPVDSCRRVFCKEAWVEARAFSAPIWETLFSTLIIGIAPYIDFPLHRTRSVLKEVQNRYLEQVVCCYAHSIGQWFYEF